MKVLWITNTIFPDACKKLNRPIPVTGGWMYNLAKELVKHEDFKLAVATTWDGGFLNKVVVDSVNYYLLPVKRPPIRYSKKLEKKWREVINDFDPDICHIHGTEFSHGLACINACPEQEFIISIQGLVGVYYKHFYAGIPYSDIIRNITLRDIIKQDNIFQAKRKFQLRGVREKEYLNKSKHVIGRTSWDLAHVKRINPKIHYYFCNENLRSSFYSSPKWDIDKKKNHSIFISQAGYPIKGLHMLLKAVAILRDEFNDVHIRVAGANILKSGNILEKAKLSGYGAYLSSLIKKLNMQENITFLGSLDENKMCEEYQNAHLFVCPSSIENSPNSLGEAQIIGVPCIASFVGGVPDMVKTESTGLLYRFDDYVLLAHNIRRIFNNDELAKRISKEAQTEAHKRHDINVNTLKTLSIYKSILGHSLKDE